MDSIITRPELEVLLEKRVVCDVLDDIGRILANWNRGGALIHRVRAWGFLAETGSQHIKEGLTSINADSTFADMKQIDPKLYAETVNFVYPVAKSRIYLP